MKLKFLCLFFSLSCVLNSGCHRSPAPQEQPQAEIDQINALKAKIEMYRERALEHDQKFNAYRQEIKQLRSHLASQTGEDRKETKKQIRELKSFANHAKIARNAERIRIQIYTEDVRALVGDFD